MSPQDFKNWESALHIDPLILQHFQKRYGLPVVSPETQVVKQRKLGILYAVFVSVSAMIIVILLGVIRCTDVDIILVNSSRTLCLYSVIGFIAGKIAEMCVHDSSKSMIRNMLQRTDQLQSTATNDSTDEN